MHITWYGRRCVRIEAKEGSILIDPFGKDAGLRGPRMNDDLVLISTPTVAKDITDQIPDTSLVVRNPGEYECKGIAVRGILAYQDSQQGKELGLATIYTAIAEDMSVCHLGALGQATLTQQQMEDIGDPDILIIPVGQGALDAKAAAELANQIEPKVIIPVSESGTFDKFIKELGVPAQKMDSYKITKKLLPVDQTILVVLGA